MARFALREFSTPQYADFIPVTPMEERPVEQIEKFMTFLEELPWFKKEEDERDSYNENMENSQAQKPEHEKTMRESVKTREDKKMEGYEPTDFDYGEASELYNEDKANIVRDPKEVEREQRVSEIPLGAKSGGDRGPSSVPVVDEMEQALLDAWRKRQDFDEYIEGYKPSDVNVDMEGYKPSTGR
jgi:hypothetical protein